MISRLLWLAVLVPSIVIGQVCDEGSGEFCSSARQQPITGNRASYQAGNKKPEYPTAALRLGESGTVVLLVLVTAGGDAGSVEVIESSGFARLDKAAVDAVKQWKFNPAISENKAIDSFYEIPITFKPPSDDSPIISPRKNTVCKTITDGPPGELISIMPDQGLYVASNIQLLDLPAKGLLDGMAALIYIKKRGRKFIQLDNLRDKDGKDSSRQLLKLADCISKEFLIQDQASFSCPWASGIKEKSPATNHIIVNRWLKPEQGSHENKILEFVCSK